MAFKAAILAFFVPCGGIFTHEGGRRQQLFVEVIACYMHTKMECVVAVAEIELWQRFLP